VLVTDKVMSSNSGHGEMYSIQHYLIKFVSGLCHISGFLCVLQQNQPSWLYLK